MADAGKQMEHSIGVNAIKAMENKDTGIREVSEWKLWEVSTLPAWGANELAGTISIKSVGEMTKEELQEEIEDEKSMIESA